MIKNITRLILITLFAYFVFDYSVAIDVEQFYKDLKRFNLNIDPSLNQTYIFISLVIVSSRFKMLEKIKSSSLDWLRMNFKNTYSWFIFS